MTNKFKRYMASMTGPLQNAEEADFSAADYEFQILPRALNCDADGTLVVDMGGETVTIYVVAGLNPYRVEKIYASGSDAITVVGMW